MKNLIKLVFVMMMVKATFASCIAPREISIHIVDSFKPFHSAYVVLGLERENVVVSRDVVCSNFAFDCGDKSDYEVLEVFVKVISVIRDRAYESWKDIEVNKKCFASISEKKQSLTSCFK